MREWTPDALHEDGERLRIDDAASTTGGSDSHLFALAARADALEDTVRRQAAALVTMQSERERLPSYARRYEAGLGRRGSGSDALAAATAAAAAAVAGGTAGLSPRSTDADRDDGEVGGGGSM